AIPAANTPSSIPSSIPLSAPALPSGLQAGGEHAPQIPPQISSPALPPQAKVALAPPRTSLPPVNRSGAKPQRDLEQKIGQYWLNRIGIVAVLTGISYFLKYAFENNWIG